MRIPSGSLPPAGLLRRRAGPPLLRAALACGLLLAACGDLIPLPEAPPLLPPDNLPEVPAEPPVTPNTPAVDDPVTITAIEPTEGPVAGLTDVLIRGTGFRAGLEVLFGESPASDVFVISPAVAVVLTPPRPAGRVDVTVLHPRATGEPGVLPSAFRYFETIAVDLVEPAEGPVEGGIAIAVTGRGFTPDTRVFFGGRPALAQEVIGTTLIRGVLPPGRYGRVAVHAVGLNGAAAQALAFTYLAAPDLTALTPIVGPPGTEVTLLGENLPDDAEVTFGGAPAEVLGAARDGSSLSVVAPSPGGLERVVDVTLASRAGATTLTRAFAYPGDEDPLVLGCSHMAPTSGPEAGGTRVELACRGLAYRGVVVRFGEVPARLLEVDERGHRVVVEAPAGIGDASVTISTMAAGPALAGRFRWVAESPLAITAVEPRTGPVEGGTRVTLSGRGFVPGMSVTFGALPARAVEVVDAQRAVVTTPPGSPGLVDVAVRHSGLAAVSRDAFDYTSERLGLSLVIPPVAARSGGTWLTVHGEGFTPTTRVLIGGVPCDPIASVSSAELHVYSPRLPVGTYDVEVVDEPVGEGAIGPTGPRRAVRERVFTSYDPRSGTGGTWGPPIDGTLNVTVWGSGGYGPVEGAFVLVGHDPDGPWRGFTNDEGQVTLSGPGLAGPVEVTASRDGFTAYSVVRFDAQNVTVLLAQNPTPPPSSGSGGNNPTLPPNATLSGRVTGLDKYVVAPPGSCAALQIPETRHCAPCDGTLPDGGCGGDADFVCLDLRTPASGVADNRCVARCDEAAPCPSGYVCGATSSGARCLPSPGEKKAYCNVASTSLFGYEYPIQARGWVDQTNTFEMDSRRLGELAIYCFGGYTDAQGVFLPTVMGVRRNVFATAGAAMTGLDVALDLPLTRAFRFRLQDPPRWSTGLQPPTVVISLDLGPDGVIPFTRTLVPTSPGASGGEPLWVAPSQLPALSGAVYDANYFLYSTLAPANTAGFQPRSYNLVQFVRSIVEDRFPVRDATGWRLEGSQVGVDLYGAYLADDAEGLRLWAVGEEGRILLRGPTGSWAAQTSGTTQNLNAIDGLGGRDVWAVGDQGVVVRWDGVAWRRIEAPFDDYLAVHVTAERVFAAGRVRLRVYDRQSGAWSLVGGPSLQEPRLFIGAEGLTGAGCPTGPCEGAPNGVLVGMTGGRLAWLDPATLAMTPIASPTTSTLRAGLVRGDGSLVLVGDGGTVVAGPDLATLSVLPAPTAFDLTAITEAGGRLVVVGDHGVALSGPRADALLSETIPDYRSRAHAAVAMPDGQVRVVGSAAFILGPFLHFPIVTAPVQELAMTDLAFAWDFTGPKNQYTRLALTPEGSITLWTMIVDGAVRSVTLPDLQAAAGLNPLPRGRYRLEVLRVLNRAFDIDGFTTREFSLYARDSWATNEAWFILP